MTEDSDSRASRRTFLRVAATAGVAALAGCPGGDEETPTPPATPTSPPESPTATPTDGDTRTPTRRETESPEQTTVERFPRYDTVVDVAASGAATDGSSAINDVLQEHAADDTLFLFPKGTYQLGPLSLSGLDNLGFRATDGADPSIVPALSAEEMGPVLADLNDISKLLIEGLTFDFTTEGHGGMVYLIATGDFEMRDVTVEGQFPPDVSGFRLDVVRRDSTGVVENLDLRGGSVDGSDSVGVYVGRDHAGELRLEDCRIAKFPNNGLYASAPGREDAISGANGPVHVRGGEYANNNIANIRLGSTDSSAKNATVRIDEIPPRHANGLNARGIRLRAREGQVIENCEVSVTADGVESMGAIVMHSDNGGGVVRDTTVTVDSDGVPAINALSPTSGTGEAVFENVAVTGSAATEAAVDVTERDGTTFEDCAIEQTGSERSGIQFVESSSCSVRNTRIAVTGEPLLVRNSTVKRVGNVIEQTRDRAKEAASDSTSG